jgi:hypothetical protein
LIDVEASLNRVGELPIWHGHREHWRLEYLHLELGFVAPQPHHCIMAILIPFAQVLQLADVLVIKRLEANMRADKSTIMKRSTSRDWLLQVSVDGGILSTARFGVGKLTRMHFFVSHSEIQLRLFQWSLERSVSVSIKTAKTSVELTPSALIASGSSVLRGCASSASQFAMVALQLLILAILSFSFFLSSRRLSWSSVAVSSCAPLRDQSAHGNLIPKRICPTSLSLSWRFTFVILNLAWAAFFLASRIFMYSLCCFSSFLHNDVSKGCLALVPVRNWLFQGMSGRVPSLQLLNLMA